MALLFMDGFEGYTNVSDLLNTQGVVTWGGYNEYQAGVFSLSTTEYRTTQTTPANSRGLRHTYGSFGRSGSIFLTLPANNELIVGFGFKQVGLPTSDHSILRFGDTSCSSEGYGLCVNSSRQLRVGRLNGDNVYYFEGTGSTPITVNNWHYIEMRVLLGNPTGECEVYLDGVQIINLTGLNTATNIGSGYSQLRFMEYGNGTYTNMALDDIYVCDTTGADNNTFLGPIGVYSLFATGAGSSTQMTPVGAASNWESVDEATADDGTTYVESSTNGNTDYYSFESLPGAAGITSVPGVMLKVKGSTDTANRGLFLKLKNGANIITSTVKNFFSGGWAYNYHIAEKAPDGTDWTPTSVDNTEAGQEVD